jgi:6-phosphogluconolactonase
MFRFLVLFLICFSTFAQKGKEILYVGTFFGTGSQGIYVCEFDRAKGKLKQIQVMPTPESPSFLAVHPSGKYLYSVNRGSIEEMPNSGSVSAFNIDPKTGKLSPLNQRPSYGSGPCHISMDKTGKWAFVSNYVEGNFVVLPIFDDGLLGSSSDSRKHMGSSVNKERQEKPHAHSTVPSPDHKFIFVSDLGTDKIYSYAFNAAEGRITPAQKPYSEVNPGSGPRHFVFHPNGKVAYSMEELTSSVAVFSYKEKTGALEIIQDTVSALPPAFTGSNSGADIHISSNGKFLYTSNRGHNSIAIFSIDEKGKIKLAAHQESLGKTPRNFMIDKKGQYFLVANQDSDNVVVFRMNQKTGKLTYSGNQLNVPSPVCLSLLVLK